MTRFYLFILVVLLFFSSCDSGVKKQNAHVKLKDEPDSVYIPKYAKRFTIKYFKDYKIVEVKQPWDTAAPPIRTILSNKKSVIDTLSDAIKTPVSKWVSVASTQISYANKLNVLDELVGMAEPEYVSNTKVKEGIKDGSIKNIGTAFAPDVEMLIALNPDMMMVSPFKDDFYGPVRDAGIKLVTNCSYLENTPLGRVEWLVYVASFFDKEKQAIKIVNAIAKRYNKVKQIARQAIDHPTLFSGSLYQGVWYVAAADSYNANFFKDAGVRYIFADKPGNGSLNFDFETVYNRAGNCDFWVMMVNYAGEYSYSALRDADVRYADFAAFKNKNIIYSNTHSSMLYERGLLEPDVVLMDLVQLLHKDISSDRNPVYYKHLTKE